MISMINTALLHATAALAGFRARLADERGQDLLEYALLGGLIAAAIVLGFVLFSGAVTTMTGEIRDCIDFQSSTICNPGP